MNTLFSKPARLLLALLILLGVLVAPAAAPILADSATSTCPKGYDWSDGSCKPVNGYDWSE